MPNAYGYMLMRIFTRWIFFQCVFHDFQWLITLLRALSVALTDKGQRNEENEEDYQNRSPL